MGNSCRLMLALLLLTGRVPATDPQELRVLTYNVLADPVNVEQRIPALLQILETANADIIVLQEVAPWFAKRLFAQPWSRAYQWPQHDGQPAIHHEYLLLSRFPILAVQATPLPGPQHRVLFLAEVDIHGTKTAIASCHLESLLEDGPLRAQQLEAYALAFASHAEVFFAGDFNFGDGEQPDTAHLPKTFHDAWLDLHPEDPGYTWDIERSEFARRESFPKEPSRRLDRILFKSSHWRPQSARILGNSSLDGRRRSVFPSDHFGLIAVFQLVKATE